MRILGSMNQLHYTMSCIISKPVIAEFHCSGIISGICYKLFVEILSCHKNSSILHFVFIRNNCA